MKAYKLKFLSSFHIDAGTMIDGPSELFIHSDTLFSAIVSAARKFYDDSVSSKFVKNGALVLSSAFPYYKDEFFVPKPLNFSPNVTDYEVLKEIKKIKFISLEHYKNILNGFDYSNSDYLNKETAKKFILNNCWRSVKNSEGEIIFKSSEVPHIVMDRITNKTQIFYKSEVYFNKDGGLYFLAEVKDELLDKFETVLRFLGDEGIGADRTTGKGLFEVKIVENFSIPTPTESNNYYYLLSLYSPTKDEFNNIDPHKSFYDFIVRGGWVSNKTLNRKSFRMFIEGSVLFIKNKQKPIGEIHKALEFKDYQNDLKHDVFRSGQAVFLPFIGGANDTI